MVDDTDVPAVEPEEAAQDAAVTEPAAPPWGDDFDAERAWKTIQNLRGFEKQAKEFERIQSDEDARAEWLKSHGYEIEDADVDSDDDEELFADEDDVVAPLKSKLEEIEQWKAEQEAEKNAARIRKDLATFNEGSDWDLDDDDREAIVERAARQNPKGFGPDELKKAHAWFIARLDRAAEAAVERAKTPKKKAPHVPAAGQAATEVPDLDDHDARVRHMLERMAGGS